MKTDVKKKNKKKALNFLQFITKKEIVLEFKKTEEIKNK